MDKMTRTARVICQVEILPRAQMMCGGFIQENTCRLSLEVLRFLKISLQLFLFYSRLRNGGFLMFYQWRDSFVVTYLLTYLFGPAIETWLGELIQTGGQF